MGESVVTKGLVDAFFSAARGWVMKWKCYLHPDASLPSLANSFLITWEAAEML